MLCKYYHGHSSKYIFAHSWEVLFRIYSWQRIAITKSIYIWIVKNVLKLPCKRVTLIYTLTLVPNLEKCIFLKNYLLSRYYLEYTAKQKNKNYQLSYYLEITYYFYKHVKYLSYIQYEKKGVWSERERPFRETLRKRQTCLIQAQLMFEKRKLISFSLAPNLSTASFWQLLRPLLLSL